MCLCVSLAHSLTHATHVSRVSRSRAVPASGYVRTMHERRPVRMPVRRCTKTNTSQALTASTQRALFHALFFGRDNTSSCIGSISNHTTSARARQSAERRLLQCAKLSLNPHAALCLQSPCARSIEYRPVRARQRWQNKATRMSYATARVDCGSVAPHVAPHEEGIARGTQSIAVCELRDGTPTCLAHSM